MTDAPRPGACAGMRVLDLSRGMAGPLAAMILADNGADVIKVEQPGGDWARAHRGHHFWNRGKRSVVVDLRDPDRGEIEALVRWAGTVITDYRPATAARLGLSHDDIIGINPSVVHCDITSFGDRPESEAVHYEATLAAVTGRMADLDPLSGGLAIPARDGPTFTAPPVASYGASLLAVIGILAAQLDPASASRRVRTSLLQGAMAFLMREELSREPAASDGAADGPDLVHLGIQLCFLTAECADGRYIQMCARQDHHFRSWLNALGLSSLLDDPRFAGAPLAMQCIEDIKELEGMLRARMATRSQAEWMKLFTTEHDIGADPFLTTDEFLDHPQMTENGRVVELDDPELGSVTEVGPLVLLDQTPSKVRGPAPLLDQHRGDLSAIVAELATGEGATPGPHRPAAGPLAGVTVLEVAYFVAGPMATALLAELGARVVKIEPLAGDPYRRTGRQAAKFLHGKESIALDLKSEAGREILHRLIGEADVLVHGFRQGVPERLGMDEVTARSINPDLVYLNAASYGSKGPEASRIAFHSTPTALSGAGILQAGSGNPPVDDSFPDPAAGIAASVALLLGLLARKRYGIGQYLETTMLCSTGYVMSGDLVRSNGSTEARPADSGQHGLGAGYRLYECSDGWIFLAAVRERERAFLGEVAGLAEIRTATGPGAAAAPVGPEGELAERLERHFSGRTVASALDELAQAGVPAVAAHDEPFEDWLIDGGHLLPAEHPAFGSYWQVPPKVTTGAPIDPRPACGIGEHTEAILTALGYDRSRIEQLRSDGVIG